MSSPQSVTRIMDHELNRKYKQTDIDYYFKDIEHGWSPGIGTGFHFYLIFIFQLQEKIGKGEFGDVRLGVYNGNKVSNSTSRNKNIKKEQNWWLFCKIFPSFSKNYNYDFWYIWKGRWKIGISKDKFNVFFDIFSPKFIYFSVKIIYFPPN